MVKWYERADSGWREANRREIARRETMLVQIECWWEDFEGAREECCAHRLCKTATAKTRAREAQFGPVRVSGTVGVPRAAEKTIFW